MMGWWLAIGLAGAAFAALVLVFKAPRRGWEAIAAALVFGLAGFGLQARPAQPGAPKAAAEAMMQSGAALVEARHQLSLAGGAISPDRLMVTSDALARNGAFADAASLAMGAAEKDPANADAWLAAGVSLVAHAEGNLTPASQYAFARAAQVAPQSPGPPFFLGLALAQSGKLDEGRALLADALAKSPADAPWRKNVEAQLTDLDQFIAKQSQTGQ